MNTSTFGDYLKQQIKIRKKSDKSWSQNELGRRSGISGGHVSMIINGQIKPDPPTLRKIAKALKISAEELFTAAGVLPSPETELSGEVLELAREIDELPDSAKPYAIRAVRSTLEAMYSMLGGVITEGYEVLTPAQDFARIMRIIERKDPELYQELLDLINGLDNDDDPDTLDGLGQEP